jgi:hypothetical protein
MKRYKITLSVLSLLTLGLYSCYETFDPESYAPAVSIGGFTSTEEIAPTNLIAYWPFDGNYTEQVSNTTGENKGTSFGNGIKGQALNGADEAYVLFEPTQAILNLDSFTLAMWVNSESTTDAGGIIGLVSLSNRNAFWGNLETFFENNSTNANGKFRAHVQNDSLDTWVSKDGIVNLFDSWNHLTLTYDAPTSTFALYVNGTLSTTSRVANFGNLNWQNPGKMVFGTVQFQTTPSLTSASTSQPWASYLTGLLDEVRMYNVALKPNEVDALVKLEARGN